MDERRCFIYQQSEIVLIRIKKPGPESMAPFPPAIAYIMFTSGSTGEPKLVRVPHCCILPNILDIRYRINLRALPVVICRMFSRRLEISESDSVFLASSLTFDPSIIEIFLAFSAGSRLVIVSEDLKRDPNRLSSILFDTAKVSILQVSFC